jgi:peptidyl-prolyl cis-trans isomerase B (cyclophilin B)
MNYLLKSLTLGTLMAIGTQASAAADAVGDHPRILMETSMGNIVLELDRAKAPKSVDNFVKYVQDGFYDGTIFHRVIKDFMAQGGGFTPDFAQKPTRAPVTNEADNGLKNVRGSIAMARTNDPHSATAQFFINTVDNDFLNFSAPTSRGWGYTVFGKVVEGMDVIDKIRTVPTGSGGSFPTDVPKTTVLIKKASMVVAKAK